MLSVEQITAVLKAKAGNVTEAAKALGVTRQGLYKRINASPALQQTLHDERETLVDMAELALRRAVVEGNMTAIIWTLKASPAAKARGWGERQEMTGPNGSPIITRRAGMEEMMGLTDDEIKAITTILERAQERTGAAATK